MTKNQYLIKLLDTPLARFSRVSPRDFKFTHARLGKEEKPSKRFTPPFPAEYWQEKNTLENNVRGYITNGVYHRSHVERFAGTHPA